MGDSGSEQRASPNEDLVRALFDAFNRDDPASVAPLLGPDFEFLPVTGAIAGRTEPYRGPEGMAEYFEDAHAIWRSVTIAAETIHDRGDQVVVAGRVHAVATNGGVVANPVCWVFQVSGGRFTAGQVFANRAAAFAAVEARPEETSEKRLRT